jgi:glycerol uptake facilitator-like aquaporin
VSENAEGVMKARPLVAEFAGTAFLAAAVVGSGIMGERLAAGNVAVALLANTLATGAALVALILTFGPISGAHFNPAVSMADASQGGLTWTEAASYTAVQILGSLVGAGVADFMFGEPIYAASTHVRAGVPQVVSEAVATFGLLSVIWGCSRRRSNAVPFAVAAYIMAAYWFTPSTSFANPAITIGRAFTNTFAGIRPSDVPAFIVAQGVGALAATVLFRWLVPRLPITAASVVMPHAQEPTAAAEASRMPASRRGSQSEGL